MATKSHPHPAKAAKAKAHDPITPGEILLTEFLEPLGIAVPLGPGDRAPADPDQRDRPRQACDHH